MYRAEAPRLNCKILLQFGKLYRIHFYEQVKIMMLLYTPRCTSNIYFFFFGLDLLPLSNLYSTTETLGSQIAAEPQSGSSLLRLFCFVEAISCFTMGTETGGYTELRIRF